MLCARAPQDWSLRCERSAPGGTPHSSLARALVCAASLGPPWRCLPPRRGALLAGEHPRAEPPGRGRPRAAPLGMCLRAGRPPARSSAVVENLMVNLPASKSRCFVLLTAGSFQLSLVAPDRGVSRPAFGGRERGRCGESGRHFGGFVGVGSRPFTDGHRESTACC